MAYLSNELFFKKARTVLSVKLDKIGLNQIPELFIKTAYKNILL